MRRQLDELVGRERACRGVGRSRGWSPRDRELVCFRAWLLLPVDLLAAAGDQWGVVGERQRARLGTAGLDLEPSLEDLITGRNGVVVVAALSKWQHDLHVRCACRHVQAYVAAV